MYTYLEQKATVKVNKPEKKDVIIPLQETINFEPTIRNPIPLYDFMQQQEHLVRYNLKEISL
jgi:hypothetical protein